MSSSLATKKTHTHTHTHHESHGRPPASDSAILIPEAESLASCCGWQSGLSWQLTFKAAGRGSRVVERSSCACRCWGKVSGLLQYPSLCRQRSEAPSFLYHKAQRGQLGRARIFVFALCAMDCPPKFIAQIAELLCASKTEDAAASGKGT